MSNDLTRREFTLQGVLTVLGGVVITVTGCSDSGPSSTGPSATTTSAPPASPSPPGDVQGTISANHGHTATVLAAQLSAGNGVTLDIQGASDHPHSITLSAGEISQIGAGQRVSTQSTNNQAHTHTVTFN